MTQSEALHVLINAVGLAQQKGAFTLKEASIVASAVEVFVPPTPQKEQTEQEQPVDNKSVQDIATTEKVSKKKVKK